MLAPGLTQEITFTVTDDLTAKTVGSGTQIGRAHV